MGASRKSSHVTTKDSAETARDIISTSSQIQSMKVPDAVAAIAQAAAKANGETEKYLPGWPLFSPPKVQLDKCTKCSREFCSSINFRRHTRVHRRTLKVDKDFPKNRDHLAAFWNKLTVDEASTVLSLSNIVVEGVTGSSILTTLSSWMCKPGYASLPMAYARAGSELLDLIQTKVSMQLPVSSNELFSVLDEASEKTFLCTNTAACIQKFLFDGEANKIATELKNVVACASYMLEQKLVEAWCADKAAEALRCQKLLVEEEEAAQKRQAELMERKRMKKLRQKEQRLKDLKDENVTIQLPEIMDDTACSPGIQSFKTISDPDPYEQEKSQYIEFPAPVTSETGNGFNVDLSVEDVSCDSAPEMDKGVVLRKQVISRHHLGRTEKLAENSFVSGSAVASKQAALARPSTYRDANVCSSPNRNKTWARKVPAEIGNQCPKHGLDVDDEHNMAPSKNSRVLIGSISVAIEDGSEHLNDSCSKNDPAPPSSKIVKHASVNVVRLVTHKENRNEGISNSDGNSAPADENRSCFSSMTDESSHSTCRSADFTEGEHLRRTMFSSKEATSFLSQRWKEAIAADHVKLVLCHDK
ncbi:hypothetical protein GQ55_2G127000 [Panicum hallii var. hallii]|uniref:C2H2-type domain-containing protein n=1 Tax=Panicum hallii var. hallii TaxID=1504633 RepID=A0A2T7EPA3_9POAL|nr:hypothetical protein GQ55_2G127000 [Panicum hallii var. hallii]PUZ69655.1 hypothetical protein GQ55_2G127000 [Panicum hallii var. hallii]